jgi:hypothetical protein
MKKKKNSASKTTYNLTLQYGDPFYGVSLTFIDNNQYFSDITLKYYNNPAPLCK